MDNTPFFLTNENAYQNWRQRKLAQYPDAVEALLVDIVNAQCLTPAEHDAIATACQRANLVVYRCPDAGDKDTVHALGKQFGLINLDRNLCAEEDGIAALQVAESGRSQDYIPYSNKPINWHTDGYYNRLEQQVHAVILHCARAAENGGDNQVLDHEIAYLRLRDENPEFIAALMLPDVMTIPANIENGVEIRPEQTGPVFSVRPDGHLHMRYTARKRNIRWRDDAIVRDALAFLHSLFETQDCFHYRLASGEGLMCNNVLHNRTGFQNGASEDRQRLLYRARYYDRIST
jgi:alpha-ketoglutarate-dependent taurine dioxygenase